jgi:hypothetical protein
VAIAWPPTPSLLTLSRTTKLDQIGEDDELLALRLLCESLGTTMPCVEAAKQEFRSQKHLPSRSASSQNYQFTSQLAGRQVLPETEVHGTFQLYHGTEQESDMNFPKVPNSRSN